MSKLAAFYQNPFPRIKINNHYYLREQKESDTKAFFKYYSNSDVGEHILCRKPKSMTDAEKEIKQCRDLFYQRRGVYWAIAEYNHQQMIGAVGLLVDNTHRRAELSYDLNKKYWNKGITTDALKKAVDFAFDRLGLERIEAITTKANKASIRVLEKLGFEFEATLKNYRYYQEQPHDVEMYCLLRKRVKLGTQFYSQPRQPL